VCYINDVFGVGVFKDKTCSKQVNGFFLLTFLFAICTPQVNLNLEIMFVSVCLMGNMMFLAHIWCAIEKRIIL